MNILIKPLFKIQKQVLMNDEFDDVFNFATLLMEMLTNSQAQIDKHDNENLMKAIGDISDNDTIDDDAKALIIKCLTKSENVTLKNLKKDEYFKP